MPAAKLPATESERLRSLRALNILDTLPEEEFDALVNTAAIICQVPISAISLVDTDRQWFKSVVGLPGVTETARNLAFCAYTILEDGILEVPDAQQDPRFVDNLLVTADPKIRFYAGAPLRLSDGTHVGALCVIDRQPRQLEPYQRDALKHLSRAISIALESRRASQELILSQDRLLRHFDMAPVMMHSIDPEGVLVSVNARWLTTLGYSREEVLGKYSRDFLTAESHQRAIQDILPQFYSTGRCDNVPYQMVCKSGKIIDVLLSGTFEKDQNGKYYSVAVMENITAKTEAMRATNSLLDAVKSQFIVSITDAQGKFIEVNDAFCQITGYSREELKHQSHQILHSAANSPELFTAMWQQISSGRSWRGEICDKNKAGHLYWVDCSISPLFDDHDQIERYIAFSVDITERIEQSKIMQTASERMMLATNSGGIGVWDYDAVTGALNWDGWMYRLYGMQNAIELGAYELWGDDSSKLESEAQQQIAMDYPMWVRHLHPQDRERATASIQSALDGDAEFNTEFRIIWPDGSIHSLRATGVVSHDQRGKAIRMVGANWDVTPLRELSTQLAENTEKLRFNEERFNLAVYGANDGLWDRDLVNGTIYYSPRWKSMLGYEEDELPNEVSTWDNQVHPEDKIRVIRSVDACISSNTNRFSNEYRMRHKDGHYVWVLDRGLIQRDSHGNPTRFIGFHTDISEQKQVERLKSEFISTVSHELRTPLTSISASLGLLEAGVFGELPSKALGLVNIASKNSKRLITLVNDILDMEKLLSGKSIFRSDEIDMNELINQSIVMNAEYAASYGAHFEFNAQPKLTAALGDHDRLMQVLANLMSNAAKFTPPGQAVHIRLMEAGRFLKVEVQDHGPGVPMEFRPRIFSEFAQADSGDTRKQGGTGLGLNITKKLVSRMDGEIGYETELGCGSTFWFTIPLALPHSDILLTLPSVE